MCHKDIPFNHETLVSIRDSRSQTVTVALCKGHAAELRLFLWGAK
jgi:hypothetical protein